MSLQQIQNVLNHPLIEKYTTMREVVELVVKPVTKQTGVSYALLSNQDKPLHADVMVSVSNTATLNIMIILTDYDFYFYLT